MITQILFFFIIADFFCNLCIVPLKKLLADDIFAGLNTIVIKMPFYSEIPINS